MKKIKSKSFKDLQGLTKIKAHGDINEHVLVGFDEAEPQPRASFIARIFNLILTRSNL